MGLIIAFIVVAACLGWAFSPKESSASASRKRVSPKGESKPPRHRDLSKNTPYAVQIIGNDFKPLSKEEVDEMFAPQRNELKTARAAARKAKTLEDRVSSGGKLPPLSALDPLRASLAQTARVRESGELLIENLMFERDGGEDRFYRLLEELSDVESDIESAIDFIEEEHEGHET